jgi:hypothetical protein
MRYAVAILTIAALCAAPQAHGKAKERAPRFADYPVAKLSHIRVAKPKVPKNWDEDVRLRLLDTVGTSSRANFAGRYFMAVWGCGSACVTGAIVEARTGRVYALPTVSSWFEVHDKFEGIDFRHNSHLVVLSGQRSEKKGDMGQHFYVWENGKLRFLRTIKTDGNFLKPVK